MPTHESALSTSVIHSEYETERDKAMPSLNHSAIQINLGPELRNRYKDQYRLVSELSLELSDWPSVPDICIFPRMPLNLKKDIPTVTTPPQFRGIGLVAAVVIAFVSQTVMIFRWGSGFPLILPPIIASQ